MKTFSFKCSITETLLFKIINWIKSFQMMELLFNKQKKITFETEEKDNN